MSKAEKRAPSGARAPWRSSLVLAAVTAALCGCDFPPVKGSVDDPLNFTASDNDQDCVYTYSPAAPPGDSEFELTYGPGISISASYFGTYEGPPGSLEIWYQTSTTPEFSSGLLSVFPPSPGVSVAESAPTEWSVQIVPGGGANYFLPYGGTWSVKFSCGAIPSCCADTPKIDVAASGSP